MTSLVSLSYFSTNNWVRAPVRSSSGAASGAVLSVFSAGASAASVSSVLVSSAGTTVSSSVGGVVVSAVSFSAGVPKQPASIVQRRTTASNRSFFMGFLLENERGVL